MFKDDKIVLQLQKEKFSPIEDTVKDGWKITPLNTMEASDRCNLQKVLFLINHNETGGYGGADKSLRVFTTQHKIQLDRKGRASTFGSVCVSARISA